MTVQVTVEHLKAPPQRKDRQELLLEQLNSVLDKTGIKALHTASCQRRASRLVRSLGEGWGDLSSCFATRCLLCRFCGKCSLAAFLSLLTGGWPATAPTASRGLQHLRLHCMFRYAKAVPL
eukprot:2882767-Amphidinium_carterae.1